MWWSILDVGRIINAVISVVIADELFEQPKSCVLFVVLGSRSQE